MQRSPQLFLRMGIAAVTTSHKRSKEEQTKQLLQLRDMFSHCRRMVLLFCYYYFNLLYMTLHAETIANFRLNIMKPMHASHIMSMIYVARTWFSNAHRTLHTWVNVYIAVSYRFVRSCNVLEVWRSSLPLVLYAGHFICIFSILQWTYIYGTSCTFINAHLHTC